MSNRPDYRISALNKFTDATGEIGVAWQDERGYIAVKFNPFVVVPVGPEFVISLFPIKRKEAETETGEN